MTNKTKGKIIKAAAVAIDVLVPLGATFSQFPVWIERSTEATMSGLFLVFAFFSVLPFLKRLKAHFRSPSVWVVWVIMFAMFVYLRNIIDEMVIVCFYGMIANIVGAVIYKLGKHIENRE